MTGIFGEGWRTGAGLWFRSRTSPFGLFVRDFIATALAPEGIREVYGIDAIVEHIHGRNGRNRVMIM